MNNRASLWPEFAPLDHRRPTVVLIHGFTGCAAMWNDVRPRLAREFNCVALELPGHGQNSGLDDADAFTFAGITRQINLLIDQIGARRVALWGYSMGGRIAMHVALADPDRIGALILESASPGIANPDERHDRKFKDEQLAESLLVDGLDAFVTKWMAQPLFASQMMLPAARQSLGRELRMHSSGAGLAAALRGFSSGVQEPLHRRLSEYHMPALLLAGELDGKYSAIAHEMARSIPRSRLRILPGVGHAPHWESPEVTAGIVRDFLLEHVQP